MYNVKLRREGGEKLLRVQPRQSQGSQGAGETRELEKALGGEAAEEHG